MLEARKAKRVTIIADIMGCHRTTITRLVERGALEGFRVGKVIFVYLDSVAAFQKKHGSQ